MAMQSTSEEDNQATNWPLHKITDIHSSNDVVLDEYEDNLNQPTVTFRSTELRHPGNRRFHQLLMDYKQDYDNRSSMERPLVALQILTLWRNQTPKGRFLVREEEEGDSALYYKDVGDKKARSRISKVLKKLQLSDIRTDDNTTITMETQGKKKSDHDDHEEATESTKSLSSSSNGETSAVSLPSPPRALQPLPAFTIPRPQTGVTRSVSQALQPNRKLYGRQQEYQRFEQIFEERMERNETDANRDGVVDFILLTGPIGVGKTAIAHQAVEAWCNQRLLHLEDSDDDDEEEGNAEPFFLKAKFEQYKWNIPNAVFVDLVTDFCEQLQARNDAKLKRRYQESIRTLLKEDLSLLMHLVPDFQAFMTSRQSGSEDTMSSSETSSGDSYENVASHRVQMVLSLFFQALTEASPNHKIIVLVEDLHFASEASVDIFTSIVSKDRSTLDVLFLATHRSHQELKPFLVKRLGRMKACSSVNYCELMLDNLSETAVQEMLTDALNLVAHETHSLRDLVYGLTKGNPAFITEVLRMLQADGALYFDEDSKQWTCDLADFGICKTQVLSVQDLWKRQLLDLPADAQVIIQYASCLMTPLLKESMLSLILPTAPVSSHLEAAEAKGLLRREKEGEWMFTNDGAIQAIYMTIPEKERPAFHLRIGQKMWGECSEAGCILLMQLWLGHELITQEEDLRTVATLFLDTSKKAAKYVGFQTAWYAMTGAMALVGKLKDTWGRQNYDLSLSIFNTAIEVCYINGEYSDELERLIKEVMEHARTFEDTLIARITLVKTLGTQDKKQEAVDLALDTLGKLGERFPRKPMQIHVFATYRKIQCMLKGKSDDDILGLPRMRNRQKLAAQQMLAQAYIHATQLSFHLASLFAFRMLELTISFGMSAMSSMGFGIYSVLLARYEPRQSFRYGRLALQICDVFKSDVWFCRSAAAFYGKMYGYNKPIRDTEKPLSDARRAAFRSGDIEFAMLIGVLELWNIGPFLTLADLERKCRCLHADGVFHGQSLKVLMLEPLRHFALKMMGLAEGDPKILGGESLNKKYEEYKLSTDHPWMVKWVNIFSMKLAYLFGDLDLAESHSKGALELHTNGALTFTYKSLILLGQARKGKQKHKNIWKARKLLKKLKHLSKGCPENFLDKQCLLEAELAWTCGKIAKAQWQYRLAILQSRDQGFWLEEALANEQLGKLYLDHNDNDAAVPFLREAQRVYGKWGAAGKVKHIGNLYSHALAC